MTRRAARQCALHGDALSISNHGKVNDEGSASDWFALHRRLQEVDAGGTAIRYLETNPKLTLNCYTCKVVGKARCEYAVAIGGSMTLFSQSRPEETVPW